MVVFLIFGVNGEPQMMQKRACILPRDRVVPADDLSGCNARIQAGMKRTIVGNTYGEIEVNRTDMTIR